jgi:hypothetical protein
MPQAPGYSRRSGGVAGAVDFRVSGNEFGRNSLTRPPVLGQRDVRKRIAMAIVHVFACSGRFHSFAEMRVYIDQTYNEDGEGLPSAFMREVGLRNYEPTAIEAVWSEQSASVAKLVAKASYADQWLLQMNIDTAADAAICVFEPNRVENPRGCSLEYLGAFRYEP